MTNMKVCANTKCDVTLWVREFKYQSNRAIGHGLRVIKKVIKIKDISQISNNYVITLTVITQCITTVSILLLFNHPTLNPVSIGGNVLHALQKIHKDRFNAASDSLL